MDVDLTFLDTVNKTIVGDGKLSLAAGAQDEVRVSCSTPANTLEVVASDGEQRRQTEFARGCVETRVAVKQDLSVVLR